MISESWVWLIFLLPLGSAVVNGLIVRPFLNRYSRVAGYITIAAVASALAISVLALSAVLDNGELVEYGKHTWLIIGQLDISFGIILDPLTAVMLIVVTGVSLMVQVYSLGYMNKEEYARYYTYMSLFTASMLGLVLASSIVQMYFFWELVGLCSYLLIGFWFQKPSAAAAAKKAFIVTRLGDFGFLLAVLYLVFNSSSFTSNGLNPLMVTDIYEAVRGGLIATSVATWLALGIFAGAVGKSAQFPLHTWLPDAMEGPTPVSALIHAATMVAAGVFLVARFFPLFEVSKVAMNIVAITGGFTAIFAASMAFVANDIKRVLAYSTISQLGYMMLALGIGAYSAAIFHLGTHAFFKSLLFLGAGSVSHATGTFDMRRMGGLRKVMPLTYITFLLGSLSLAGVFPLSGFWSKDEILGHAWASGDMLHNVLFWVALTGAFMTAFYISRAVFITFEGHFRGGAQIAPAPDKHGEGVHLHESPVVMVLPLVVLAGATIMSGFLANPISNVWGFGLVPTHWLSHFLSEGPVIFETEGFNITVAGLSTIVALAGI